MRLAHLDAPVYEIALTVGYSALGVIGHFAQYYTKFGAHVFARHQLHTVKTLAVGIGYDVAQLN